jgi:fructokinase
MNSGKQKRPVIFGEVLFDHFPDGSAVLGGAPFNVAWHLQAFGRSPLFISRVGDDPLGRGIREKMMNWGMDTSGLQLDSAHPTGTVEVSLTDGEPSFDIVDARAYDFIEANALPPEKNASLFYHGSLALRGAESRKAFEVLAARLAAPRFVDVNLRDPWWQREAVIGLIHGAAWVKLNEKELALLEDPGDDLIDAAEAMRERRGLRAVVLTRGARGAQVLASGETLSVTPEPAEQVVDTVGAGDAFTSVILLGLLNGWPLKTSLERAQVFASAIVGVRGATVQDSAFYAHFLAVWGVS